MGQKVVQLIGHITEKGPRKLAKELVKRYVCVSNMPDPTTEMLVLCLSHPGLATETWKQLEDNPQAKVIPALFNKGPILPTIYADIRGLDFATNFDNALAELLAATENMVKDR